MSNEQVSKQNLYGCQKKKCNRIKFETFFTGILLFYFYKKYCSWNSSQKLLPTKYFWESESYS